MRLPLWIPDGEEGWILCFPATWPDKPVCIYYGEEQQEAEAYRVGVGEEAQVL